MLEASVRNLVRTYLAIAVVLVPGLLSANMPQPHHAGTYAAQALNLCPVDAESCEKPAEVEIVREELSFDVTIRPERQYESPYDAQVVATYVLDNRGSDALTGETHFLAAGLVGSGDRSVRLDGEPLKTTFEPRDVPDAWTPPDKAPAMVGGQDDVWEPIYRERDLRTEVGAISFEASIPPGRHRLTVSYQMTPSALEEQPHIYGIIPYILAPAKTWDGFGKLDLEVRLPPGYGLASTPELERVQTDGRPVYSGQFDGLPADHFVMSVGPNPSDFQWFLAHQVGGWAWLWSIPLFLFGLLWLTVWLWPKLPDAWGWLGAPLKIATPMVLVGVTAVTWIVSTIAIEELLCVYPMIHRYMEGGKYLVTAIFAGPVALWVVVGAAVLSGSNRKDDALDGQQTDAQ